MLTADEKFMENVYEARENGYSLVCSECGVGIFEDDTEETHERKCSQYEEPSLA